MLPVSLTRNFHGDQLKRRLFVPVLATFAAASLTLGSVAPATAATSSTAPSSVVAVQAAKKPADKVTVSKIKNAKVNKKTKKATVKPSVKASGNVKITSKKITVKQGKKTLAKNKDGASLKAGKYSVTTTAKYKTWTNKTTTKNVKKKVLVSGPKKAAKMNCTITGTEHTAIFTGSANIPVIAFSASCTGDFSGKYYTTGIQSINPLPGWKPTAANGGVLLSEGTVIGKAPKPHTGQKFTANIKAGTNIYKTVNVKQKSTTKVWSKEKTKSLSQTLLVQK